MSRYVTVTVTNELIQLGVRSSTNNCPLALAIRSQLGVTEVHVEEDHWDRGLNTEAPLSEKAQRFIRRFDAGEPVTPQRFRLEWPTYQVPRP